MSNISRNDGQNKTSKKPTPGRYLKIYYSAQETIFKLLIFFAPLIFVANTNEIFEFPKMYFVYFLGATAFWLFVLKKSLNKEAVKWPDIFINLFLLAYAASTYFSSHTYTSIWGYYTRFNGGLISVLIFYGIYMVLINEFNSYQIKELANVAVNSALVSAIYGVMQHYQIAADVWKGDPAERAFSTLGQPNWMAAFLAMVSPTLLGKMFGVFDKYDIESNFMRAVWWGSYIIIFMALWFTYSVSGILGFALGVFFFLILNRDVVIKRFDSVIFMLVITFAIAAFNMGIFNDKLKDIYIDIKKLYDPYLRVSIGEQVYAQEGPEIEKINQPIPEVPIENVEDLKNIISDPGFIRTGLWKGTLDLYRSSNKTMLIGTGPETFPYEFQKFRPAELNYSSEWDFVFNKPHNYYLELLVNIGAIGTLFYLFIVLKSVGSADKYYVPGLIAFYTTNIFGWPTVTTALLFWLFLAGIEQNK